MTPATMPSPKIVQVVMVLLSVGEVLRGFGNKHPVLALPKILRKPVTLQSHRPLMGPGGRGVDQLKKIVIQLTGQDHRIHGFQVGGDASPYSFPVIVLRLVPLETVHLEDNCLFGSFERLLVSLVSHAAPRSSLRTIYEPRRKLALGQPSDL